MSENRKSVKPVAISVIAVILMAVVLMVGVTGCKKNPKDADVNNPVKDSTEVEVPNNTDKPEVPVEDPDSEVVTEEPVDPEEPVVNMVDFETWAKQEGNEDVCLVIWNEELNIQEVMLTLGQSGIAHEVREGDRFAIPYRENIKYVNLLHENGELDILGWKNNSEYMEVVIPIGENVDFYIDYVNENGEVKTLAYAFK